MGASSLLLALLPLNASAEGEDKAARKLAEAQERYSVTKAALQPRYRKDLAELIAGGDRIEVYLLDVMENANIVSADWASSLPADEFPILPHNSKSKILKKVVLTAEQRKEVLPALQKILGGDESSGLLCHWPIHGVRVFSGEKVLFQTSICWECRNFYVDYPDGAEEVGLGDSAELQKILEKVMPIPEGRKKKEGQ